MHKDLIQWCMKSANSDSGFFSNPGQLKDGLTINFHTDLRADVEKRSLFETAILIWLFVFVHSLTLPMWRCIRRYTP